MSEWIQVEDELPWGDIFSPYGPMFVYSPDVGVALATYNGFVWRWYGRLVNGSEDAYGITHWQDKPGGPTEQNTRKMEQST